MQQVTAHNESPKVIDSFTGPYRFLSNFWLAPIVLPSDGLAYPSVEHAFQASKTLDHAQRQLVHAATTPGRAKRLGDSVTLRPDWDNVRFDVMRVLLQSKFTDNDELRAMLIATGDAVLVEGNMYHDQTWGDCRCGWRSACSTSGENFLGNALMLLRSDLTLITST